MAVTHRLGNLDLAVLSDGQFYLDAGAIFGIVPRVMWEPYAGPLDDLHRLTLGLNSLLLRSQGKLDPASRPASAIRAARWRGSQPARRRAPC